LPSKLETSDQTGTQQVTATGQQNNGQKATGSVKLVNCSQDGSAANVPAGTGITANGLSYITQSSASMPNSAYFGSCKNGIPNTAATVNVTAQGPGSKYNSDISGGDPQITATPAVGQPASTANVSIKTTYTVLTVRKDDLSQAIEDQLGGKIDKTKQKLTGNFLNDASVTVQSQSAPNAAVLAVNENTTAVPIISIAAVKKQAEGKKSGDVKAALENWPGVKSVEVKLSPFWVSKVPKKDKKVTVVLKEVKDNSTNSAP
jgi:hypothetical protein